MTALAGHEAIHIVGVGGAGMSGLAKMLAQLGHTVTGSDLKPSRLLDGLPDSNIGVWLGHRPEVVNQWDLVVASSAVPDRDPELEAAREAGIPVWRRPQLLDALTSAMPALGFTGTHGKTTCTAMAIHALRAAGRDPSFLLGGELVELNTNAHLGERDLFALEADEAFGTFLDLHLHGLLVTNVEADHLDHYGTMGNLEDAFLRVVQRTDGPSLVGIDDPGARRLASRADVLTYGTVPDADWSILDVTHGQWRVQFRLRGPGTDLRVEVGRPGLHIARNAAGVLALLAEVGVDPHAAAAGLGEFTGVRRRFEVRAQIGGVTVVDDYAHHPTELAATLSAARIGNWRRVWAVFQPHRYSRTAQLAGALGSALAMADQVVVSDVYGAEETPEPGITGKLVADAAVSAGATSVAYVPSRGDLAGHVATEVAPGDLVLLLGAGDVTSVAEELAELLDARS